MPDREPHPELLSFLGAIKAEPEEDTPKLALADWLQEQPEAADQARGEFLRQFVRNRQLAKTDPAREDFSALIRLWNANEAAWAGRLKGAGFKVWATAHMFRWGLLFPALDWIGYVPSGIAATEEYAWVAGVAVRAVDLRRMSAFATSPLLDSLVGLRLAPAEGTRDLLDRLCASPRVARVQWLDLGSWNSPLDALARPSHWTALRHLVVNHFDTVAEFRTLCNSSHLAALRSLDVSGAGLLIDAGRTFAKSTGLPALVELNLGPGAGFAFNRLGSSGMRALVAGERSGRLRKLSVASNNVGDGGVEALCAQPHVCNLTHLNLADNKLTKRAALALAGAEHLETLEHLDLSGNAITSDGALALAKSPHLTNLRRLVLSANNRLGASAVDALRERFGAGVTIN